MSTVFRGQAGTERVVVELRGSASGGIVLESQSIGPLAARTFGEDEVETFLTIGPGELRRLIGLLRDEATPALALTGNDVADAIALLAARYAGDSAATSHLRAWLDANGIAYEFFIT